jgi:hypothetical protein
MSAEWLNEYLDPLVGATIEKAYAIQNDGETWPTLEVITKDGERLTLEIGCDEEGNGPGFLFGLERPQKKARTA